MRTVAIDDLKDHFDDYLHLAQLGEEVLITARGQVVAELRSRSTRPSVSSGLQELAKRGLVRDLVPNDPSRYQTYEPAFSAPTAQQLIDWERGDR